MVSLIGAMVKSDTISKVTDNYIAILEKVRPDAANIRALNLAAVKDTTVQVTRLPL
jgi:hypothetical protein